MGGYIYICGFSNGMVKVGLSKNSPEKRIKSHELIMSLSGAKITDSFISIKHLEYKENESNLIEFIRNNGEVAGSGREWSKISFINVSEFMNTLKVTPVNAELKGSKSSNDKSDMCEAMMYYFKKEEHIHTLSKGMSKLIGISCMTIKCLGSENADLISKSSYMDESTRDFLSSIVYCALLKRSENGGDVFELYNDLISSMHHDGVIPMIDRIISISESDIADNQDKLTFIRLANQLKRNYEAQYNHASY